MPIKFRCSYCRQFLGISRAQAGGIVDCPTCGRSIRVPMLDGTLQPLPTPELNMQDAHLARALDELAQLAEIAAEPILLATNRSGEASDEQAEENEIPQPIPEPIPIEVPIPPTPIRIDPPLQANELPPDSISTSAEPAGSSSLSGSVASHKQGLLAELASLAPPATDRHHDETPSSKPRPEYVPPRSSRSLGRISFAILGLFLAGMFVERFARILESLRPAAVPHAEQPVQEVTPPTELTGRITFKTAEGESQPDRGAKLIVIPETRAGEVKLPITGFRPSDSEADAKVAAASLKALGGALASTDEQGRFLIDLPAGNYRVLILSHFQSREETESVDPTILNVLAGYFDKPDDLLGRVKFHFAPLRVRGTGDVWDHTF